MTRDEFLRALSAKLSREMSQAEIAGQISYYQGYIDAEIAKGNAEEAVVASLGDPALIAKTLLNAPRNPYAAGSMADSYEEGVYQAQNSREFEEFEEESSTFSEKQASFEDFREVDEECSDVEEQVTGHPEKAGGMLRDRETGGLNWNAIGAIALIVLVAVLLIVLFVHAVAFFLPVILVVAGITLIMSLFRRGR